MVRDPQQPVRREGAWVCLPADGRDSQRRVWRQSWFICQSSWSQTVLVHTSASRATASRNHKLLRQDKETTREQMQDFSVTDRRVWYLWGSLLFGHWSVSEVIQTFPLNFSLTSQKSHNKQNKCHQRHLWNRKCAFSICTATSGKNRCFLLWSNNSRFSSTPEGSLDVKI